MHIGVQAALSLPSKRPGLTSWVLLGCVIPDLPWVLKRVLSAVSGLDGTLLALYAIVQSTLLFSVVLALAVSLLARSPLSVWLVVSANCLVHLLLDAIEIKPGNGVHLFAPMSWELVNFGLFWPEDWQIVVLSGLGIAVALLLTFNVDRYLARPQICLDRRRVLAAVAVGVLYFIAPLALLDRPLEADNRYLQTLSEEGQRTGKIVRFDRDRLAYRDGRVIVVTGTGAEFALVGEALPTNGVVSLEGRFIDQSTIEVTMIHVNRSAFRDWASIAGLLFVGIIWSRHLAQYWRAERAARALRQ